MNNDLMKLGFSEGEARIYIATLELGETSVAQISKKAKIERTTAYGFIESLKKRGYLTVSKSGKKTVYLANNPKRLKAELEERNRLIDAVLPELLSITNALGTKPKVRFFDTREGIYDIYRETLEYPDQRIVLWMSSPWFDDAKFWTDYYLPTRLEKKIHMRAIVPKNEESAAFIKNDRVSLRETRTTDSHNITADIMLYGTKNVAIISYKESTALVIESKQLFETLKMIFEANWQFLSIENN